MPRPRFFGAMLPASGQAVDVPPNTTVTGAALAASAPAGAEATISLLLRSGGKQLLGIAKPNARLALESPSEGCRLYASGGTVHITGQNFVLRRHQARPADRGSKAERAAERAQLQEELERWLTLGRQRRALFDKLEAEGADWEAQALAQGLKVDSAGLALHLAAGKLIRERGFQKGVPAWRRAESVGACKSWKAYAKAVAVPSDATLQAVISDTLSFPLTAAHAARLAGVAARPDGSLSLLILGAESGAELAAAATTWSELLGAHGLGASSVRLTFVGPNVPARLDGSESREEVAGRGVVWIRCLRGKYHSNAVQARLFSRGAGGGAEGGDGAAWAPQLALAFNSGLAEFAASWVPTWRAVWKAGLPLAITSYHDLEAQLDVRTLVCRAGVASSCFVACADANPFASRLPHLDEVLVGQCYVANAFLSVCAAPRAKA